MNKPILRAKYLAKRRELKDGQEIKMSEAIKTFFLRHYSLRNIKTVHTFLPIEGQKEVNTWYLIHAILENYPKTLIIIPKTNFGTNEIENFVYTPDTDFTLNKYKIPEPIEAETYYGNIDMVFVPLLCADKEGFRVGYGGGFYDRFLERHPESLKIGLSFFDLTDEQVEKESFDIPLDACILPGRIEWFG